MKSLLNLRYLYKVHSKRIIDADMNLTLDYSDAVRNQEVISLASSTTLRMIEDITGEGWKEKEKKINKTKKELKEIINKKKTNNNNKFFFIILHFLE